MCALVRNDAGDLSSFFGFATALADAGEAELTFPDDTAGGLLHAAAQLLGHCDLGKIGDGLALGADEVDMGFYIAVEALDATHGAKALDQTLLLKQRQVAIDRCQGNIRVLSLEHFVDHFR